MIYYSISSPLLILYKSMNNREKERRASDRRIEDRRKQNLPVEVDRRSSGDRRDNLDRRLGPERRAS